MQLVDKKYSETTQKMLAKDAPFHWFLFDQAKLNSRYRYPDFQHQAEVLEAHLDGLGAALETGQAVESWLDPQDWGCCFILAALGIRYQREDLFKQALDQLNEKEETHYREIIDACLWNHHAAIDDKWLVILHQHDSPLAMQSCIGLLRTQRRTVIPEALNIYLSHTHPTVKIQLLNWIGELQQTEQLAYVQRHYTEDNPLEVRFAAARAGFLLKDPQARPHIEHFALTESAVMLDAISLLFIKENQTDNIHHWLKNLWSMENAPMRVKLYATAIAGLRDYVEPLLEAMTDNAIAQAAGEAFTLLTGVDIEEHDLDSNVTEENNEAIEEFDPSPTISSNTKEKPFTTLWEEDLPYPDTDACYLWWESNQSKFNRDEHYLAGLSVTEENLQHILREGNQRQRHLAAMHLSLTHNHPWQDPNWLQNK